MSAHDQARTLIERAFEDHPYCPACAAPTIISEGPDGGLWLVCSTAEHADGLLARVSAALVPHVRALVVDPEVALAA